MHVFLSQPTGFFFFSFSSSLYCWQHVYIHFQHNRHLKSLMWIFKYIRFFRTTLHIKVKLIWTPSVCLPSFFHRNTVCFNFKAYCCILIRPEKNKKAVIITGFNAFFPWQFLISGHNRTIASGRGFIQILSKINLTDYVLKW